MFRRLRRYLAAAVTALASHGFSRSAPPTRESAQVMTDADAALREIEYEHVAPRVRPEFILAYQGPKTAITDDVIAMNLNARRGAVRHDVNGRLISVGGLWRNSILAPAHAEFDEFIQSRTHDD